MDDITMADPAMHPEETTFAELMQFVKAELEKDPNSDCKALSEKYGVSPATMDMLIQKMKS